MVMWKYRDNSKFKNSFLMFTWCALQGLDDINDTIFASNSSWVLGCLLSLKKFFPFLLLENQTKAFPEWIMELVSQNIIHGLPDCTVSFVVLVQNSYSLEMEVSPLQDPQRLHYTLCRVRDASRMKQILPQRETDSKY